jgi:ABC-type nickel/cobalt efflux system permease component RcnA
VNVNFSYRTVTLRERGHDHGQDHGHDHAHDHGHDHGHGHGHDHDHGHDQGTVTVRSGTVRYERSRSRTKNETFTVYNCIDFVFVLIKGMK